MANFSKNSIRAGNTIGRRSKPPAKFFRPQPQKDRSPKDKPDDLDTVQRSSHQNVSDGLNYAVNTLNTFSNLEEIRIWNPNVTNLYFLDPMLRSRRKERRQEDRDNHHQNIYSVIKSVRSLRTF